MIEKGMLGDKTKGGFYKKDKATGELSTLDPYTGEYRKNGGDAGDQEGDQGARQDRGSQGAS